MCVDDVVDTIFLGEASEVLRSLPESFVQCIVTSPGYFGNHRWKKEPLDSYMERHLLIYKECYRVLKEDGVFFLNISDMFNPREKQYLNLPAKVDAQMREIGFKMPQPPIIWLKDTAMSNKTRLQHVWEHILIYSKSTNPKFYKERLRVPSKYNKQRRFDTTGTATKAMPNVWHINKVFADGRKNSKVHSCPFPTKLVANALTLSTDEGDVVLDPLCGAATVCYVAKEMGRKWVGVEIDAEYHKNAVGNMTGENKINPVDLNYLESQEQVILI